MRAEVRKRLFEQFYGRIGNLLVGAQYQSVIKKKNVTQRPGLLGTFNKITPFENL